MNDAPGCVKKSEPEFELIIKSFSMALDRYNELNNRTEETVAKLREFRNTTPEPCEKSESPVGVIPTLHTMVYALSKMNDRLERTLNGLRECV